jgi:hypothetical protein
MAPSGSRYARQALVMEDAGKTLDVPAGPAVGACQRPRIISYYRIDTEVGGSAGTDGIRCAAPNCPSIHWRSRAIWASSLACGLRRRVSQHASKRRVHLCWRARYTKCVMHGSVACAIGPGRVTGVVQAIGRRDLGLAVPQNESDPSALPWRSLGSGARTFILRLNKGGCLGVR